MQICSHSFKGTYQFNGLSGADMLDYDLCTGTKRQQTISGNKRFFSNRRRSVDAQRIRYRSVVDSVCFNKCRIFFMKTDWKVKCLRLFHCLIEKGSILKRNSVICESTGTGSGKFLHRSHLFTLESAGDSSSLENMDVFQSLPFHQFFENRNRIDDR